MIQNFLTRSRLFEASKTREAALSLPNTHSYGLKKVSVPVKVLPHDRFIVEQLADGSVCKRNDVRLFLEAQNSASLYGESYLNRQSTVVPNPLASYVENMSDDDLLAAVSSRYENGQRSDMMRRSEAEQRRFREHIDAMVAAAQQAQAAASQPTAADKTVDSKE